MSALDHYRALFSTVGDMVVHLPTIRNLVVDAGAQQVIELGVRGGVSSAALLAGLEETGGLLWSCEIANVYAPDDLIEHPA